MLNHLLKQYKQAYSNNSLFDLWEKELNLRQQIRELEIGVDVIILDNPCEIELLFRALYFPGTQRNDFFLALLRNLNHMAILKWLTNSPGVLVSFLEYLPWHIDSFHPQPDQLQFLVRIYQHKYHLQFTHIVNVLDLDACSYLLSRSANPELRNLIKEREQYLFNKRSQVFYGLANEVKSPDYPTIFGDKVTLLMQAAQLIESSSAANFRDPYGAERFNSLLDASQAVFACGLIDDCLALLLDFYEDYQQKNRLVDLLEDEQIYKRLTKMVRKTIPLYVLLFYPFKPYAAARHLYTHYFPRLIPDQASIQYLNLYQTITSGLKEDTPRLIYEIFSKANTINSLRDEDIPLLEPDEVEKGIGIRLLSLQEAYQQKLVSLPHESFITMEFLRLMQLKDLARLDSQMAGNLLETYIQLWNWIPASLFLNQDISRQLLSLADISYRNRIERLLEMVIKTDDHQLKSELAQRPDLFRKKGEELRRQIITGKLMGVLK